MPTIDDEGWVKLYRKFLHNPIFKDSETVHLMIYSLLKANHQDRPIIWNGQETLVKRGQFITGLRKMAEETGISIKKIRSRSQLFENLKIWHTKRAHTHSIITVCNYEKYQGEMNEEGTPKGHTEGTPRATNKNDKNEKNTTLSGKKTPDPRVREFLDFWGETFQTETGQPYTFSFGKDGGTIKDLLRVHSLELLQDTARAFFRDERCKQRGLDIGIFRLEINRLIGMKAMDPLEQARREMGMR